MSETSNERIRLVLLASFVMFAYYSFLSDYNMGGGDAHWYHNILHDALIQLHHGIFPVYVGQSEFNFIGSTDLRAPYYFLLGELLDVITLGFAKPLFIQHLTVFVSAMLAAFLCYFLLTSIAPKLRWQALAMTIFYISCPGIIGLIYYYDAYHAFMAVPYIPLVIFGLIRIHQKNNLLSYVTTAAGLALVWMCHPPIALWTTAICMFFLLLQVIFFRRGITAFVVIFLLTLLLNCWQFGSINLLNLGNECAGHGTLFLHSVLKKISADVPAAFLPLGWTSGENPNLQLGYSLWFIFLTSFVVSIFYTASGLIRCLLICVLSLLLFLYPFAFITQTLWSFTPDFVREITTAWIVQRLYIILAAIICVMGMLTLTKLQYSSLKKTINCVLIVLLCWSGYETYYFVRHGKELNSSHNSSWQQPENIMFYNFTLHSNLRDIFHDFVIDPLLKNRLLDKNENALPSYDNELYLTKYCTTTKYVSSDATIQEKTRFPFIAKRDVNSSNELIPLLKINVTPNQKFLLCASVNISNLRTNPTTYFNYLGYSFEVTGNRDYVSYFNMYSPVKSLTQPTQVIALPIYINDKETNDLLFKLASVDGIGTLVIKNYNLIKYNANSLPITIDSFTPYKAHVKTPTDNTYLEIFKQYMPGYVAIVNNIPVQVSKSKDSLILIPLKNHGMNVVTLHYVGVPLMRWTLLVSIISWGLLIFYVCLARHRNKTVI